MNLFNLDPKSGPCGGDLLFAFSKAQQLNTNEKPATDPRGVGGTLLSLAI